MNSTLTIAQRELSEKRFVFVAAVAFLLLTLVLPFTPGIRAGSRGNALLLGSLALATTLAIGLSAILGSTIIGKELSDGRLSFYFSKPLPATSIWWGKLIAAVVLIAGAFVIVAAPALVIGSASALQPWINVPTEFMPTIWRVLAIAFALFLFTHVIGTFVRSRSAWFLADFVAASICGIVTWMLARQLLAGYAEQLTRRTAIVFAVFTAMCAIAAGAWQVTRGRTDRRRSHLELSKFLWPAIGSGLVVASLFVAWVVAVRPGDIVLPHLARQSPGEWAFVGGSTRHRVDYRASFLYNLIDRRYVRLPAEPSLTLFSADGKVAGWFARDGNDFDVWYARLDARDVRPVQTRITLKQPAFFNLSPDGAKVITIDRVRIVTAYDVRTERSLGSAQLPEGDAWSGSFIRPDLVRLYGTTFGSLPRPRTTRVFDFDLTHKTLTPVNAEPSRPKEKVLRDGSIAAISADAGQFHKNCFAVALLRR